MCIKDKSKMNIRGTYTSDNHQTIMINVYPCVNSTGSNITCASIEEQRAYYSNVSFNL